MDKQKGKTIHEVVESMNEEQQMVLKYLVGLALQEGEKGDVKHAAETIFDLYFKN